MSTVEAEEEVNWLDCVSAIETDKGVVYFCDNEYFAQGRWTKGPEEGDVPEFLRDLEELAQDCAVDNADNILQVEKVNNHTNDKVQKDSVTNGHNARKDVCTAVERKPLLTPVCDFVSRFQHGRFMYSITAYNPLDTRQDSVQNCHSNQLLLHDLRAAFPAPDAEVFSNFSYFPHRPHHFERGFTVILPLDYPKNHRRIVHDLALKYKQAAYFKCKISPEGQSSQVIVLLEDYVKEVEESLVVVERLSYHPAFLNRKNNSVFHAFHDAMNILSKCNYLPEASQLMEIAEEQLSLTAGSVGVENDSSPTHPVLVMEGTSDAGISKQSLHLSQAIGATRLQSPPACLQHLRSVFDAQNQLVRGAFYTIGNYLLASQVDGARRDAPVVLDRYWNSTAAFTISSEVGRGVANLPPRKHSVYEWPADLLKPDAIILVGSRKGIRNRPAAVEAKGRAGKEKRVTRQLMFEILRRMRNSSWIEVDQVKDKCPSDEAVTMVTIDKLHELKIGSFHSDIGRGGMCPGATLHPVVEHDILPVETERSTKFKSKNRDNSSVSADIGFF